MGIKTKAQIFYVLFFPMAMCIIAITIFNVYAFQNNLLSTIKQITDLETSLTFSKLETALQQDGDKKALENVCKQIPAIVYADIKTKNGRIYYTYGTKPTSLSNPDKENRSKNNHSLNFAQTSFGPTKQLPEESTVQIIYKVRSAKKLIDFNIMTNVLLIGIFLVCSYMAVYIWSRHAIERPIDLILSGHNQLAKGDFDIRMDLGKGSPNELVQTYQSFNNMARELQHFRDQLQDKNLRLAELNSKYKDLNDELEIQVQKKTKELREFFYLVTHDLKVPLAAAQGYTALLMKAKTGKLNAKQEKFVKSISMAHTHLLYLVRNMIDSIKYESNKVVYFMDTFNLTALIDEIQSNLRFFLEEKNLTLLLDIPEKNLNVYADKMKIGQVLSNLINNAITISENNTQIILKVTKENQSVRVEVIDKGRGIAEDKIEHIFSKFTQFPYGSKGSGGMGLGLFIVKQILEGHKQTITVESKPGKGSAFKFTLPMTEPSTKEEQICPQSEC